MAKVTILREVFVPTSFSYPFVGAALNLMTKSFESMSLPRPEPRSPGPLLTTPQLSKGEPGIGNRGSEGRTSLTP